MDAKSKEAGGLAGMLSEILKNCPEDPYLRMRANQAISLQEKLHKEEGDLLELIAEFQAKCTHERMMEVRKHNFGLNMFIGHKCPICKIFKPRKDGPPSVVCYKCGGGDMKYTGRAQYGMDDVRLYKCTVCGYEHGE